MLNHDRLPTKPNLVYTDRVSAQGAMAALGDPLDPMPDKWVVHVLADDDPRLFASGGVRVAPEKPDPMGDASLADRLRAMGAIRTKHQSGETVEWVNAPLAVVVDQAYLAASGRIADVTHYDEDTLYKVRDVLDAVLRDPNVEPTGVISALQNAGILFRERVPEVGPNPYKPGSPGNPLKPEDWPIPRYAMLDIWMAIHGAENSESFEHFADRHGFAETWARICAMVRNHEYAVHGEPERVTDAEEHTHHTREARDQCAAGDHKYAELLDLAAEREKVRRHLASTYDIPAWREREKLFESRDEELSRLWHAGKIDDKKYASLRRHLREEFGYGDEPEYTPDELKTVAFLRENAVELGITTMAEEPREHAERRQWLDGYLAGFREGFERAGRI